MGFVDYSKIMYLSIYGNFIPLLTATKAIYSSRSVTISPFYISSPGIIMILSVVFYAFEMRLWCMIMCFHLYGWNCYTEHFFFEPTFPFVLPLDKCLLKLLLNFKEIIILMIIIIIIVLLYTF